MRWQAAGAEAVGVLPRESELALLPALLAHARYSSDDDLDLDDDEWARVREQVVRRPTCSQYAELA
jgi:hypothetical protein